jgi:hypothetical protein
VAKLTEKFDRQPHPKTTCMLEPSGDELNLVCLGLVGLRSTSSESGQWMGNLNLNRLMERIDWMVAE